MNKRLLILFLMFLNCSPENECYNNGFVNYTEYEIDPSYITESGWHVDLSALRGSLYVVDFSKINRIANNIDICLQDLKELDVEGICYGQSKILSDPMKRDCIVIKVVPPDGRSFDGNWQMIEVHKNQYDEIHDAHPNGCREKGLEPSEERPCRFRWTVQNGNTIITPPDIYLYALVEIHTGCREYWYVKELARCAMMSSE